jgi:AraC family transcriptional regulator of adaptative response/methylated-DNA-[protein]-cysteine methyltransferase
VAKACRLIEASEEAPSLEVLARTAVMSPFHFHRVFKSVTGLTPKAYADAHRARRLREELAQSSTVTAAIYGAGFNSEFRREPLRAGAVGGYRGGFKRKRALLARERAPSGVR